MGERQGRSWPLDRNGAPRPDVDRHAYDGLYASCIRKCGDRNNQSGGSVCAACATPATRTSLLPCDIARQERRSPIQRRARDGLRPRIMPPSGSHCRRVQASALPEAISRHSRLGTACWTSIPLAEALFIFSYIMLWIGCPVAAAGQVKSAADRLIAIGLVHPQA